MRVVHPLQPPLHAVQLAGAADRRVQIVRAAYLIAWWFMPKKPAKPRRGNEDRVYPLMPSYERLCFERDQAGLHIGIFKAPKSGLSLVIWKGAPRITGPSVVLWTSASAWRNDWDDLARRALKDLKSKRLIGGDTAAS